MLERRIAILDIDRTLYRGILGVDFLQYLKSIGTFPENRYREMVLLRECYRRKMVGTNEFLEKFYSRFAQGLRGSLYQGVAHQAEVVMARVDKKVYHFVKFLVRELNDQGFETYAVSSSPEVVVDAFGSRFEIGESFGTHFVVGSSGTFTGEVDMAKSPLDAGRKMLVIERALRRGDLPVDWTRSIAIGDGRSEMELMRRVGHSIAFEPELGWYPQVRGMGLRCEDRFSLFPTIFKQRE